MVHGPVTLWVAPGCLPGSATMWAAPFTAGGLGVHMLGVGTAARGQWEGTVGLTAWGISLFPPQLILTLQVALLVEGEEASQTLHLSLSPVPCPCPASSPLLPGKGMPSACCHVSQVHEGIVSHVTIFHIFL